MELDTSVDSVCSAECDTLDMDDYLDLLWTSAAELPGTNRLIDVLPS